MAEILKNEIRLPEIVGKGYREFWNCRKRYRVVKGSRASKKSTTTALNLICRLMEYPAANVLVIRKTAATLKDSCFAQLQWAINRLQVSKYWKSRVNPLELEYIPTGQRIIFRGCDDPLKITSITVPKGHLCWSWIEEAFELSEEEFNRIDESLRGKLPPELFIQLTVTFNPWSSTSFLKAKFFDIPRQNVFAMTTTYECNEWLSESDREYFEEMKKIDPDRYLVAGCGNWGIPTGQYFKEFTESQHVIKPFKIPDTWIKFRAMDWGQAKPYCVLWFAVDYDGKLYVYRELYGWGGKPNVGTGETAAQVAERICGVETKSENVRYGVLDNACWARTGVTGPTISEEINMKLSQKGLVTFGKSSKGRLEGANALKQRLIGNKKDGRYEPAIKIFSNCVHLIRTLPQIGHDAHDVEKYDTTGEDHAIDACIYGCLSRPWTPTKPGSVGRIDVWREDRKPPSAWTY